MTTLSLDGNRSISLGKDTFNKVQAVVSQMHRKSKALETMVIDIGGLLIYQEGQLEPAAIPGLATLASANHCATTEMAKVIGETAGFRMSFLEGKNNSIFTTGITEDFLLTTVFDSQTTFGMVRLNALKAAGQLQRLFMTAKAVSPEESMTFSAEIQNNMKQEDFQSELASKLDNLLGGG